MRCRMKYRALVSEPAATTASAKMPINECDNRGEEKTRY